MNDFVLKTDRASGETSVSNIFIDEYMPYASGEYVKVYLYLLRALRAGNHSLSVPAIADMFDHTENDVYRALNYWAKMNILRLEYDPAGELQGICLLEVVSRKSNPQGNMAISLSNADGLEVRKVSETSAAKSAKSTVNHEDDIPEKRRFSAGEMKLFHDQKEIRELMFICETYLGKTLTPGETQTLLYLYDGLKFSPELISYLLEYCVGNNHKNMRYIETVAIAWHKEGIRTAKQAEESIVQQSKGARIVMKAFGIRGRSLGEIETSMVKKWFDEYGFDEAMVREACNRTIAATHSPSFEYADSILMNWKKNKVKSLADVKAMDESRVKTPAKKADAKNGKNAFHNFEQREYDFSKLESQLINQNAQ